METEYDKESIAVLTELGNKIMELISDKHYDAAASFWPESLSVRDVIIFSLNCAESGDPMSDEEDGE